MNQQRAAMIGLLFLVFLSRSAAAEDSTTNGCEQGRPCREWGMSLWGLSYHTAPKENYNYLNWGLGVRCYTPIRWGWFGSETHRNRVFIESDLIRDSHDGMLVPLSIATEYKLLTFSPNTTLLLDGAFTAAYYGFAPPVKSQLRIGPVPGLALQHHNLHANVTLIPRTQRDPLAAVTASMTILFGAK